MDLHRVAIVLTVIAANVFSLHRTALAQQLPNNNDAFVSNGGTLSSFAQAQNLILTNDTDFGRFVDASITGPARQRAIELLEVMPAGMRGDFIDIENNGSILSNRSDLPSKLIFKPNAAAVYMHRNFKPSKLSRRTRSNHLRPLEYPPTSGGGGPYVRDYSQQGVNAAFGVVYPPCDADLYHGAGGDSGNMYFNAWAGNNGPSGSQTDAGVAADEYPSRDSNQTDVFSFVNSGGVFDPNQVSGQYVNTYESWSCGYPLVILYGTLAGSNQGTSMLAVGPPDYDPMQFNLTTPNPPENITLTNPAWTFFSTPPSLQSAYPGNSSAHITALQATVCSAPSQECSLSVKRKTTETAMVTATGTQLVTPTGSKP